METVGENSTVFLSSRGPNDATYTDNILTFQRSGFIIKLPMRPT